MADDIDFLLKVIRTCMWIAAFFTTLFPVLYSFSPWRSTRVGQLLMFQAIAFALAIDVTLLFQYWAPMDHILVIFWVNLLVFAALAASTGALTFMMWKMNHPQFPHKSNDKSGVPNE